MEACWFPGPSTVATLSRSIKEMFDKYLEETADSKDGIGFMLHDFGMRGVSTMESAGIGGAGHLINFLGTDTVIAMEYIEEYYGGVETGYSVPATEHSVMTARGVEGEKDVIKQLIENHPTGILSVVSDSYDIYRCVDQYYGVDFKEEILARDGKFVVRPDSGDPVKVVCGVFVEEVTADSYETFIKLAEESLHDQLVDETPHGECGGDITRKFIWNDKVYSITYSPDWNRYDKQYYYIDNYGSDHTKAVEIELSLEDKGLLRILWDRFGGSINSKGYKVLNPKIGLIWGDGVDSNGIQSILAAAKKIGFSAENLVFGMGGHLLQRHNRDTQRFAFKSSAQKVAGEDWKDIYKDPIDGSKKSKKGKLALIDVPEEINATRYQTVRKETVDEELNILVPVFRNGELLIDYNFNEVIKNSSK